MNSINLIGRITADLELEKVNEENVKLEFRIAVDGVKSDDVSFIPIVVWNRQAELVAQYLGKGQMIGITGRLSIQTYKDKQGNNRSYTEVVANKVTFVGSKEQEQHGAKDTTTPAIKTQEHRTTTSSSSLFR